MRLWQVRPILFLCVSFVLIPCGRPLTADSPEVPVIDAGLGSCRADFTVKDGSGKALYNAKISLTIKYGFWSLRKTELEIGMPNSPKRPLDFSIKSGNVSTTVTDDPSANCKAVFDVTLTVR